jgi:hypothetical protein
MPPAYASAKSSGTYQAAFAMTGRVSLMAPNCHAREVESETLLALTSCSLIAMPKLP